MLSSNTYNNDKKLNKKESVKFYVVENSLSTDFCNNHY